VRAARLCSRRSAAAPVPPAGDPKLPAVPACPRAWHVAQVTRPTSACLVPSLPPARLQIRPPMPPLHCTALHCTAPLHHTTTERHPFSPVFKVLCRVRLLVAVVLQRHAVVALGGLGGGARRSLGGLLGLHGGMAGEQGGRGGRQQRGQAAAPDGAGRGTCPRLLALVRAAQAPGEARPPRSVGRASPIELGSAGSRSRRARKAGAHGMAGDASPWKRPGAVEAHLLLRLLLLLLRQLLPPLELAAGAAQLNQRRSQSLPAPAAAAAEV
jgi:hypothetical protein